MPASRPPAPAPESCGRLLGSLAVLVLLAGLTAWSVLALDPPAPAAADAPATSFSAERAFVHVEEIASEVHVTGSPAHDRVVDGLVATLGGLVVFGLNGFVIGPVIAAVFLVSWDMLASVRQQNAMPTAE